MMGVLKKRFLEALKRPTWNAMPRRLWRRFVPIGIRNLIERYLVITPEYLEILDRIGREVSRYRQYTPQEPLKILYGPSFSIYPPCFVHDRVLTYALRLRGAAIYPVYCDAIQSVECDFYGGDWMGKSFGEKCRRCVKQSQRLWQDSPIPALRMSRYLDGDGEEIERRTARLDGEQWVHYVEDDLPLGQWARDILVNNYLVGDYHLIPDYPRLGLAHLRNLLRLKAAYERIVEEVQPDRAVSSDSYYGMWAILQKLCERKGIPYYSHWQGARPGTWCYAFNDAAMNLDFSRPWRKFSQLSLTEQKKTRVREWLTERRSGKGMIIDTASAAKEASGLPGVSGIDTHKPTALLASNVIWDLAALNKQIVFDDMIDWIAGTIRWFEMHPEFQLLIKPHPGELHPSIPATRERVESALMVKGVKLPDNVRLLPPRVNLTVYDLFPLVQVALVHTTTVGMEVAAEGLPVITTARSPYRGFGFTLDPSTRQEYFDLLERVLGGESPTGAASQTDLAYKFILFYYFHYYTKIDIMGYNWGEEPVLKVGSAADIIAGRNQHLDYIVDSIINGLPILSGDRWPAES